MAAAHRRSRAAILPISDPKDPPSAGGAFTTASGNRKSAGPQ